MSAGNLPGIVAAILVLAFGAVGLAFRIPQSRSALRLQSLRRAGTIGYLTRRMLAWMDVARAFEVQQVGRLKWEFFIRVTRDGWTLSNSDLIARAFIPWSAIGSIRVADDAPANTAFRNVHLRVTFEVRGESSDLEVYLYGWLWAWYPLPSDPSANPIDVASMNAVVRELEGLRPPG